MEIRGQITAIHNSHSPRFPSVLPHSVLQPQLLVGLLGRVPVPARERRAVQPGAFVIIQLEVEHGHEKRPNDAHLELGEPHPQARVPPDAPPHIPERLLLVLRALGEEATRVPLVGVRVHLRVEVDVVDPVEREAVAGDDLARGPDGHVAARDVLAEGGADELEADRLAQGEVDERELGLPVVEAQRREDLGGGLGGGGAVLLERGVYLALDAGVPLWVGGQVAEEPAGVDARVDLAGEEGAEDELVTPL